VVDVRLFAWAPWRFRDRDRVRAAGDDVGDGIPEPQPYVLDPVEPAGVFPGVVEQRADRLGFVGAVLEGDARDPEQVREVRDLRPFTRLTGVDDHGVLESFIEFGR
jgi:hypothetical protein